MKQEKLKSLISESIDESELTTDYSDVVMDKLYSRRKTKFAKIWYRRPLLVAALLFVFSLGAYAASDIIIKLTNGEDTVAVTITENESEWLKSHENQREIDHMIPPSDYQGNPCLILDTTDPTTYGVNNPYITFDDYDEFIGSVDLTYCYPEILESYTLLQIRIAYSYLIPTQEELDQLASEHQGQQYFFYPLERQEPSQIVFEYRQENKKNSYFEVVMILDSDSAITLSTEDSGDYEIVELENAEALLYDKKVSSISYLPDNSRMLSKYTNDYRLLWSEGGRSIVIRPSYKTLIAYAFPDDTAESMILLAKALNQCTKE
ncbi:MAG: hypothetical protein JEZ08_04665 [Clostridiales bacterium]|nr:hypothetical protein [Clostridiales bacterium]